MEGGHRNQTSECHETSGNSVILNGSALVNALLPCFKYWETKLSLWGEFALEKGLGEQALVLQTAGLHFQSPWVWGPHRSWLLMRCLMRWVVKAVMWGCSSSWRQPLLVSILEEINAPFSSWISIQSGMTFSLYCFVGLLRVTTGSFGVSFSSSFSSSAYTLLQVCSIFFCVAGVLA